MDFRFTKEQENFRAEIKAFIETTLTKEFWSAQEAKGGGGRDCRLPFPHGAYPKRQRQSKRNPLRYR